MNGTRRNFLTGGGASIAMLAASDSANACPILRRFGRASNGNALQERASHVAQVIANQPSIADVTIQSPRNPTHALFQWRWLHFNTEMHSSWFPIIIATCREIVDAMSEVLTDDPHNHIFLLEGLVKGDEQRMMEWYMQFVRTHIATILEMQKREHPSETPSIEQAMKIPKYYREPVIQRWIDDGKHRNWRLPIDARIGPWMTLHFTHGIQPIYATEDPDIDRHAEWAQRYGNPQAFRYWLHDKRDPHFIDCALEHPRNIVHFLVGCEHDLTEEIEQIHRTTAHRLFHVVITPKTVQQHTNFFPRT